MGQRSAPIATATTLRTRPALTPPSPTSATPASAACARPPPACDDPPSASTETSVSWWQGVAATCRGRPLAFIMLVSSRRRANLWLEVECRGCISLNFGLAACGHIAKLKSPFIAPEPMLSEPAAVQDRPFFKEGHLLPRGWLPLGVALGVSISALVGLLHNGLKALQLHQG